MKRRRTRSRASRPERATRRSNSRPARRRKPDTSIELREIESLRAEVARLAAAPPPRWNASPDDVRKSVAKLVLTLVEFIRQLLERQAIRRMEAGTLTEAQTEQIGLALMRLEETIREMAAQFGLDPGELNLELGPVGKLL